LFRPIKRLNKGTSGLVLVGKSQYAHQAMFKQQKQGQVQRCYQALVEGVVLEDQVCIDLPIGYAEKLKGRAIKPSPLLNFLCYSYL
jgi:23S rRNA pseudouridine1911/1915/1917 synthase